MTTQNTWISRYECSDSHVCVGEREYVSGASVTCVYMVQVVTAEVEKFEVFGQHKMFWLEMFYFIVGQIHPHYVRWQVRWDANQICRQKKFRNIRPSTFMIPERQKFLLSSVHTKKRYVNRGCEHFRLFNSDRNVSASLWLQDGLQVVCNFLHFQDVVKGDIMYDNISLICQRDLFSAYTGGITHTHSYLSLKSVMH